ncbi:hypothetical protein [Caballeronia zhejiangensis]|uniref:hypothetical protein n=1 Tax=Caballeronia zhejiangensis TaxID=871203 RepID=UPI00158E4D19|nr:hypothetical protein [Caballeronia zhejiangensis]MCG7403052.1 hypothetical protein [Caballeronia zhejiangensis]MCI1043877.1 hypothetical protein [Caballeronia zhejiangensis]
MNEHHRRFFDPRSLSRQQQARIPIVAQIVGGLLTALLIAVILLAITSAAWAILYLIHTAP